MRPKSDGRSMAARICFRLLQRREDSLIGGLGGRDACAGWKRRTHAIAVAAALLTGLSSRARALDDSAERPTGDTMASAAETMATPAPDTAAEASAETAGTKRVIAGRPEYHRSGYFKFHFGEGYRKLWTSPFEANVLDLGTYAGGLTPVRQVGSEQSIGLALKGADGRSYTFRTLDKDPTKILPPEWRSSFPAMLFQDQTTASHPGAAFIVPALAEAVGVPHTNPVIVYMPDDPTLGEFKETFGARVGMIDEYPTAAGNGYAGFLGATEILSTSAWWERWKNGEGWIDTRALLRARLLDLFIGDWDRHNGQWRWLNVPGHEGFIALPEDRDQAFADFSGAVMGLARSAQP